mgnify:CR=1 FL=1
MHKFVKEFELDAKSRFFYLDKTIGGVVLRLVPAKKLKRYLKVVHSHFVTQYCMI